MIRMGFLSTVHLALPRAGRKRNPFRQVANPAALCYTGNGSCFIGSTS
jgi:hypothetical protein